MSVSVLDDFAELAERAARWRQTAPARSAAPPDRTWERDAACRGMGPARFYPPETNKGTAAKQVCADCPVKGACLAEAMAHDPLDDFGVRGGLTEWERQHLRGNYVRPGRPIRHGTEGGYKAHRRRHEPACDECMTAQRVASAGRRSRRNPA